MAVHLKKEQLVRLEQTLRSIAFDSSWFFLEPQNQNVREDIRGVLLRETGKGNSHADQVNQPQPTIEKSSRSDGLANQNQNNREVSTDSSNGQIPQLSKLNPGDARSLDSLHLRVRDCDRCPLCFNRKTVVFGQGNIEADVMFVGEAPGEEEDKTGLAFVGKAGKLLTQIIQSIGLNRQAVYICNVIKCRPPGNRNPVNDEISSCLPILFKQIELVKPKLIVSLGNVATKNLVKDAVGIMKMRGKKEKFNGIPLIPTFHPSYLLRNPSALSLVWSDMRKVRQMLFQDPSISSLS